MKKPLNVSSERVKFPVGNLHRLYRPSSNEFHAGGYYHDWTHCREVFHRQFRPRRPTSFYYSTTCPYNIGTMLDWVESTLGLQEQYRTQIHICSDFPAIRLDISQFWISWRVRQYFLTIAIRAANNHLKVSALRKLLLTTYCRQSPRYTASFLDGCTIRRRNRGGWCVGSRDNLIRPSRKEDLIYFEDNDPKSRLTKRSKILLRKHIVKYESNFKGCGDINATDPFAIRNAA